jgi:hypothetical protein
MLRNLILVVISSLFLFGCTFTEGRSALEIYSTPNAKVFLDGKESGMSPYKNNSLKPGEITVRLESNNNKWERKIRIRKNLTTVINWTFDNEGMGGYILSMEKTGSDKSGIIIDSIPNKASIFINNEIVDFTPKKINDVGVGEKQLTLSYPGYKGMNMFLRATKGYDLILEVNLIKDREEIILEPTPIPASNSINKKIIIKETETGWLRVREASENNSKEIAKVNSGEIFELIEEKDDKWKIKLNDDQEGWIANRYAEIAAE